MRLSGARCPCSPPGACSPAALRLGTGAVPARVLLAASPAGARSRRAGLLGPCMQRQLAVVLCEAPRSHTAALLRPPTHPPPSSCARSPGCSGVVCRAMFRGEPVAAKEVQVGHSVAAQEAFVMVSRVTASAVQAGSLKPATQAENRPQAVLLAGQEVLAWPPTARRFWQSVHNGGHGGAAAPAGHAVAMRWGLCALPSGQLPVLRGGPRPGRPRRPAAAAPAAAAGG